MAVTISPRWNSTWTSDADVGTDLLGQVGQRGAPGQPDLLPVTGLDPDATDRRRLHLVELLTPLLLGLATAPGRTTGAAEGTLGAAAATTATTAAGRRTTGAATRGTAPGGPRRRDGHGRRHQGRRRDRVRRAHRLRRPLS